jgi:hypothetical protein
MIKAGKWKKVALKPGVELQSLHDRVEGEDFVLARYPEKEKHIAYIAKLEAPYRLPGERVSVTSRHIDNTPDGKYYEFEVHATYPLEGEMSEMWPDALQDYLSDLPQVEREIKGRLAEIIGTKEEYILVQGNKVTLIWGFVGLCPASTIIRDQRYDR